MAYTARLPAPVVAQWDWQRRAACRGMDVNLFFPPPGERQVNREQRAKQVCAGCPVRAECLEHALRAEEPYGIWGGLAERERAELIRRRRAIRPLRGDAGGRVTVVGDRVGTGLAAIVVS